MIIKTMSHKSVSSPRYLVEYVWHEKSMDGVYTHNFLGTEPEQVIQQFEENTQLMPKRSNGAIMRHDIISLEENKKVPIKRQAAMLEKIVARYVQLRCPKCLVYGKLHREKANLHFHLLISANNLGERSRHWMRKSDLAKIQQEVEAYQIQEFPELGDTELYSEKAKLAKRENMSDTPQIKDREAAYIRRTGQLSRKQQDHNQIKNIFAKATSEVHLKQALQQKGFMIYKRGRLEGVQSLDGRKYRLRTIGLEAAMQNAKQRIAVFDIRRQELNRPEPSREINQERS